MLLRSSSTPILNSWPPQSKESCPSPDKNMHLPAKTKSVSHQKDDSTKKLTQTLHVKDLQNSPKSKEKINRIPNSLTPRKQHNICRFSQGSLVKGELELKPNSKSFPSIQSLFWSCGLDDKGYCPEEKKENVFETPLGDGVGSNNLGSGLGGSGGGDGGGWPSSNGHDHESDDIDAYYRMLIEANPGNALLLGNYAKFLKEVRGDYAKAEEYCGRAILGSPNDSNILSLYADLIWETQKDANRAETYHDQAVKEAPDDCYVLASYAKFLWDAEDEAEPTQKSPYDHPLPLSYHSTVTAVS